MDSEWLESVCKKCVEEINKMSHDEFIAMLDKHRDGPVASVLMDLHRFSDKYWEVGDIEK